MTEELYRIALQCTGGPNNVTTECILEEDREMAHLKTFLRPTFPPPTPMPQLLSRSSCNV